MPGGLFPELLLPKWSDSDSSKIAAGHFTHNYGLDRKSSLMIFDRHANLKYKYGNRQFWCTGYYVDTVGRNKKVIEAYIRSQLQDDIMAEQLCLKELVDPFTGEPVTKGK